MKRLRIILITLGSLILLPFLIYGGAAALLSPDRLTGIVNKYSNKYLSAHIEVDTVTISLFSEFPYVGIKLSNGSVISEVFQDVTEQQKSQLSVRADSLLHFKEIMASISLPKLLRGKIDLRRVRIIEPDLYAYVSPWGVANWDIMHGEDAAQEESDEDSIDINIKRIAIRDSKRIAYNDRQSLYYVNAEMKSLFIEGNITNNTDKLELSRLRASDMMVILSLEPEKFQGRVIIDALNVKRGEAERYDIDMESKLSVVVDQLKYCSRTPFDVSGSISVDNGDQISVLFDDLGLAIAGNSFILDGQLAVDDTSENIVTELVCKIDSFDITKILEQLPQESFPEIKKISTGISIDSDVTITGIYSPESGRLPYFTIDFDIPHGHLAHEDIDANIRNIEFKGSLYHNPFRPDSTGILISGLTVLGSGIDMNMSGEVLNILNDPLFSADIKGNFNLDSLVAFISENSDNELYGVIDIDMNVSARLSDMDISKIGNIRLRGNLNTDSLYLNIPELEMYMIANGSRARFGSVENTRDTLIEQGTQMLMASYSADTLNFKYGEGILVEGSDILMRVRSAASTLSGDTTVVHPLSGTIRAARLRVDMDEYYMFGLANLDGRFDILPSPNDPAVPRMNLDISSARAMMRDSENRFSLIDPQINIYATIRNRIRQRPLRTIETSPVSADMIAGRSSRLMPRAQRLDSLQRLYPEIARDSLMAHDRTMREANRKDDFSYADIEISLDKQIRDILMRWDVSGNIQASGGRITTPYFPLRNEINKINLFFTTDEISFHSTEIVSGNSHLALEGKISNIRRMILGRGVLQADVDLYSDMLDIRQLQSATFSALAYSEMSDRQKNELKESEDDKMEETLQEVTVEQDALLVIPSNIEVDLNLLVNRASYDSILLDRLRGDLTIRDRSLHLQGLSANSNAGGFDLSALYTTKSKEEIKAGFDMELHDVEVERFIELIPSIDSIFPMLRSFEGVLNCQLTAKTDLDTNMNFILPSLNGACRIKGDNLVLLDGETFAEIAKMLKFKNKKRNLIDNIAVELLIKDNRIEVFPFLMTMDRYTAAISGTHNFDMNFLYHISVLKSPIPLKIGLNVSGNLDDLKIKVGKTLYKNTSLPVYTHLIDEVRVNLKESIINILKPDNIDKTNSE